MNAGAQRPIRCTTFHLGTLLLQAIAGSAIGVAVAAAALAMTGLGPTVS